MNTSLSDGPVKPSDYFIKYVTDENEPYYCSIATDETVWDMPDDGALGMNEPMHAFIDIYIYAHMLYK